MAVGALVDKERPRAANGMIAMAVQKIASNNRRL
jgi:hypothetical protein